jgi:hypothetical protein
MSALYFDREPGRQRPTPRAASAGGKWSNDKKRSRNTYPGQGTTPLSNEQKATICIAAAKAFSYVHKREPVSVGERETWRRLEQEKAVGRPSLTVCTQAHYLPLLAHFQGLAGEDGAACRSHVRDATAPHRVALHKLREICQSRGFDLSYAAAICRSKYKCPLDEATDKQIWSVYFDIKNRKGKARPAVTGAQDPQKDGAKRPVASEADIPF